jgi:hypothetical protein
VTEAPEAPTPSTDWHDSLPADLKTHPSLQDTKSVESLARQHIDAQALIGKKGVIRPTDDSPEERNRYLAELGRPAAASGYTFKSIARDEQTPEVNGFIKSLGPIFHAAGSTDEQADAIAKGYLDIVAKDAADKATANEERAKLTVAELKTKWGLAFDARQELALRAGNKVFGEEMLQQFAEATLPDGSRVGDSPGFIESLYENLGAHMSEDQLVSGSQVASSVISPDEAKAEIARLETDSGHNHIYFDTNHPEHKMAQDKMKALHAAAYPEGGAG